MTPEQIDLAYQALRRNDGNTLCTDWPADRRRELSVALDRLRSELMDRNNTRAPSLPETKNV